VPNEAERGCTIHRVLQRPFHVHSQAQNPL
jgi:hypothetical protein